MKKVIAYIVLLASVLGSTNLVQAESDKSSDGYYFSQMVEKIRKPTQVDKQVEVVQAKVPTSNFFGYAQKIKREKQSADGEVVIYYNNPDTAVSNPNYQEFFRGSGAQVSSESE